MAFDTSVEHDPSELQHSAAAQTHAPPYELTSSSALGWVSSFSAFSAFFFPIITPYSFFVRAGDIPSRLLLGPGKCHAEVSPTEDWKGHD